MELSTGTTLHGFTVETVEPIPEFEGIAYRMRHTKSGARLLYLKTDDANKAFSIAFKTPPVDSTGVFHILEHSVLCGSKKFPAKEPFVNLLKSSMQTFLNAMTFPDKTMYPVASTNETDLLNLMDVYMDAVLNPNIYEKRAIFEQEGWHYELESAEEPLTYNGVVFNEMKGALSDPDSVLYNTLCAALFPDTAYAFESGGDPANIPDLTYEAFLDHHRRHYRLDNSYIMLYGDMQVEHELAFLDEKYLSVAQEPAKAPNPLVVQPPVKKTGIIKEMQTSPENAAVGVAFVAGEAHERERILALDILLDALMGSNEAPLKRALLDADLADDINAYLVNEQLQPIIVFQAQGSKPDTAESFSALINETLATIHQEGVPKKRLEAVLSHAEFTLRERDFGVADGVVLAMQSLTGWLYDDELATAYLHYEEAFDHMRSQIDKGYFEDLIKEVFLESKHLAQAEIKPVEESRDNEREKLDAIKASLLPEDIDAIREEAAELRRIQETPDSPEDLATLPLLKLSDIGEPKADPAYQLISDTPLTCLYHNIPTRQIDYVYHYFDLTCLEFDDLPYAGILMRLLGKLDTEHHTAEELDYLLQAHLGGMRFFIESYSDRFDPNVITPKFIVGASALSENIEHLALLPAEIWSSTKFDNTKKIQDILGQSRIAMEQEFINSGHAMALSRVASYYAPSGILREQLVGVDFYRFLKDLLANFDSRADDLVERLNSVAHRLFIYNGTITSFTGSPADRDRFWELGGTFDLRSCNSGKNLTIPAPTKKNEAFIVPTDVCFAAQGYDRRLLGVPYSGTWQVASRILSYDYLWSEVRVKGGAYGGGFKSERSGGMQFYSYRDPNLDSTLTAFTNTGSWLKGFSPSEDEMSGYIISSVAGYDAPKKPRDIARRQDIEYFSKLDPHWRLTAREETLNTTVAQLRELAPVIDHVAEQDIRCVFGNKEIIKNAKADFDVVDLLN